MKISFITNTFLSIFKIIFGVIGKSGSLIADGIHSFSDLATDIIAIIGNFLSSKPADSKHPYGHGKLEYLTSMIIGVIILILGLSIIYNSSNNGTNIPSMIVILVSIITIILKYFLASYIIKKGKYFDNHILIASGEESKTDVISSLVVLFSTILMHLSKYFEFLKYADTLATIIVGIFIVKIGFSVLKENISVILGEQETKEDYINKLKNYILDQDDILDVKNMVLLKFGPCYKLTVDIILDGDISLNNAHKIVDSLEKKLIKWDEKIKYMTIHMEPKK